LKVAVSGATGFVGRHVVAALERAGIEPTLWLGPGSAVPDRWRRHRVARIDVHAPPADAFAQLGVPDALIHLAWQGLPNYASLHHFEREGPAHYAVLKSLVEHGLGALVVAGTCFEYGMQSGPLDEARPALPANAYALAKDTLRRELEQLQRQRSYALTWARLFYLHGEPGRARAAAARARRRQRLLRRADRGAVARRALDRRARLVDPSGSRPLPVSGARADGVLGRPDQAAPLPAGRCSARCL